MAVDRCGYQAIGKDDNDRANAKAHRPHKAPDQLHPSIPRKQKALAGKNGSVSGDTSWSRVGKSG